MSSATTDFEHPVRTRISDYRYVFKGKHHGGNPKAGTWRPEIGQIVEFGIFDFADENRLVDDRQRLYGLLRGVDGKLVELGTWEEQIAEFQAGQNEADAWHGYPHWALNEEGPPNRRNQKCRPSPVVLNRMVDLNLIDRLEKKRFLVGRHA